MLSILSWVFSQTSCKSSLKECNKWGETFRQRGCEEFADQIQGRRKGRYSKDSKQCSLFFEGYITHHFELEAGFWK